MSEIDDSLIYQGFWTNHDDGAVLGATITTTQQNAQVVVALLAVVVTIAAESAWNLFQFAAHQFRATSTAKDGLFRQQQALLRSLASPGTVFTDSVKMLFVWRNGSASHVYLRCLIPALLGLAYALASLAAGVFSNSVINTTGLQVLVEPSNCRMWNSTAYRDYWGEKPIPTGFQSTVDEATRAYAQQCYTNGPVGSQCHSYVLPRFDNTAHSTGPCPFDRSICSTTPAIVFDTGNLDSHQSFGLNAAARDRVKFRRKTTCTPLNVPEYSNLSSPSDIDFQAIYNRKPFLGEQVWVFRYGSHFGGSIYGADNMTYQLSTVYSNVSTRYDARYVTAFGSPEVVHESTFDPIEKLRIQDADLSLIFVFSNAVNSIQPIDDPIYAAHQPTTGVTYDQEGNIVNITYYQADEPVGVMGCTEQYEYCIPQSHRSSALDCSGLTGVTEHDFKRLLPSASERQLATIDTIAAATSFAILDNTIELSDPPFLASLSHTNYLSGPVGGQLWELDVQKMEGYVRAQLQWMVTMQAAGYPIDASFTIAPFTDEQKAICRSQKVVKQGGFANINVFGLSFTLAFFGLVTLLDFCILRFLLLIDRPARRFPTRHWIQDGVYQLQRSAYKALGAGMWTRETKEIPRTTELLQDLGSYGAARPSSLPKTSTTSQARSSSGRSSSNAPTTNSTAQLPTAATPSASANQSTAPQLPAVAANSNTSNQATGGRSAASTAPAGVTSPSSGAHPGQTSGTTSGQPQQTPGSVGGNTSAPHASNQQLAAASTAVQSPLP